MSWNPHVIYGCEDFRQEGKPGQLQLILCYGVAIFPVGKNDEKSDLQYMCWFNFPEKFFIELIETWYIWHLNTVYLVTPYIIILRFSQIRTMIDNDWGI